MSVNAVEVEIFARKPHGGCLELNPSTLFFEAKPELQAVGAQESLAGLLDSFTNSRGDLVRIQGYSECYPIAVVTVFLLSRVL